MYKHYETSDDVFVDREEHIEWMNDALERCKEKSPVMHLRGIGGIGKSSLLDHWTKNIESAIRLDCLQHSELYSRLDILAKGAVRLGVNLQRFDILWHIRKRFVEGVEPAAEQGRTWAKEVLVAIPFIGSLASIGGAIKAVGDTVAPKFRGKYGEVGQWLQDRLGKQYLEKLLEILWKDPRHAEFLYLDALLEDINNRKDKDSILMLFDHFENVDTEDKRWRYSGMKISEADLWYVFLTSLSNCVGVVASRNLAPEIEITSDVEKDELTELDRESCIEMLDLQGVKDENLQEKIISISGGNPFVIDAMCDILNAKQVTNGDIEGLRAGTLEEVRLKTWRKLFSEVKDLTGVVDKAGLLPFFDRRVIDIVMPEIKTDQYERLLRLSFVRNRGDSTFVLHDLARELVITELGSQLEKVTGEASALLEKASEENDDFTLRGLSFSVQALSDSGKATKKLVDLWLDHGNSPVQFRLLEMLEYVEIDTEEAWFAIHIMKGWIFSFLKRTAEAEDILLEVIERATEFIESGQKGYRIYLAHSLHILSVNYFLTNRSDEMESPGRKSLDIYRQLYSEAKSANKKQEYSENMFYANCLRYLTFFSRSRYRLSEAEEIIQEGLSLSPEFTEEGRLFTEESCTTEFLSLLSSAQFAAGKIEEAESLARKTIEGSSFSSSDLYFKSIVLSRLGSVLLSAQKYDEAEKYKRDSLDIIKKLYGKEPDGFYWMGVVNDRLGVAYTSRHMGRFKVAESLLKESIELARKHASEETMDHIGWVLIEYADLLNTLDRHSEAETYYIEAIEIIRKTAESQPKEYLRFVLAFLNNYGISLRRTKRISEAERDFLEALEIGKSLSKTFPEAVFFSRNYSVVLNNLGVLYSQTERYSESEDSLIKAVEIWRDLVEKTPLLFVDRLTATLNNYGILLSRTDRLTQSEEIFREALEMRRDLSKKREGLVALGIASVLNNLGIFLKRSDRLEEAQKVYQEACDIYEDLIKNTASIFERDLIRTLSNLRLLLTHADLSNELLESVNTRLKDLGISEIREEEWSEEDIVL
ncbi:MAG: tetratricopeptide repeat protein [Candidatus Thorarchaeota archaeon]